jgi:hypothetical protein
MANAPLPGRDGRACNGDLPDMLSEIFSAKGLDTISGDLPVGQITWVNWRRSESICLAIGCNRFRGSERHCFNDATQPDEVKIALAKATSPPTSSLFD